MKALFYLFIIASLIFMVSGLQERHYYGADGRLMKAWYVTYPGYETAQRPEDSIDLKKWASRIYGTVSPDDEDYMDKQGALEEAAGKTLKKTVFYVNYRLEQQPDGHWKLWKPTNTEEYFSFKAFYRISPGQAASLP